MSECNRIPALTHLFENYPIFLRIPLRGNICFLKKMGGNEGQSALSHMFDGFFQRTKKGVNL